MDESKESKNISLENEVDSLRIKSKSLLKFLENFTTSIRICLDDELELDQLKSQLTQKIHCAEEFIDKGKKEVLAF